MASASSRRCAAPATSATGRLDEGAEHDVVGVDDLSVLEHRPGRHQLVPGGDDGDPRSRVHGDLGDVRGGGEGEVPGPEPGARPEQDRSPATHVLPPAAHGAGPAQG